jgi:hypothetical protein
MGITARALPPAYLYLRISAYPFDYLPIGGNAMAQETEARIAQLRTEGYGYKRIASVLNLPLSTVKSICYRHGFGAVCVVSEEAAPAGAALGETALKEAVLEETVLVDPESVASESLAQPTASTLPIPGIPPHPQQGKEDPSACRQCGSHIDQIPGRKIKRFCSSPCRMKWWRAHREQMNHRTAHTPICAGCGVPFDNYWRSGQKYCCRSCYFSHRFAKSAKPVPQRVAP